MTAAPPPSPTTTTTTSQQNNIPYPRPPAWRTRLVQWDMSHNAIPLALFAYTSVFQAFSITNTPFDVPIQFWYTFFIISLVTLFLTILLTILRICIHPQAILKDFNNPRLVNFFFLPAIIGAAAILAAPPFLRTFNFSAAGFYVLLAYQTALSLYLFGEWLFAKASTTSIYPLVFMQTIAFFLLSILASSLNLQEQATATLAVGVLLWLLVFITNFQHLGGALSKKEERPAPTFFLFIAPPAQAALAVMFLAHVENNPAEGFLDPSAVSDFPSLAKAFLYVDVFLYMLMFRLFPTWWRTKFSVAWWAYVFPLSAATCAMQWKFHTSQQMFFFVVSIVMFAIATFAVVVVATFTVWAVYTGRLPKNAMREKEYTEFWIRRNIPFDQIIAGESDSVLGADRV